MEYDRAGKAPRKQEEVAVYGRPAFQDLDKDTRFLRGLLIAGAIGDLICMWSGWLQLQLLSSEFFTEQEGLANDRREQLVNGATFCLLIVTYIVFGRWIYRAHSNLPALGVRDPDVSPGWAVGWFFIPIASFWKPYAAMHTLSKASSYPQNWRIGESMPLLPVWWTLWLASNVMGQIVFRTAMKAETLEEMIAVTKWSIGMMPVDIALNVAAYVLVGRIWEAQSNAHTRPAVQQEQPQSAA